jgi:hypothetical protein
VFGLFERKVEPVGPFGFGHAIEIEKPAAEVYALVDWADPRNAKRALGNKVEQVAPDRFRLLLDMVPDHTFEMIVTDAVPGETYAFENEITPPVGRLVSSRETYTIEPRGEGACVLTLTVEASFVGGLSDDDMSMEVLMMTVSCGNALEKLKVQAEQGVDAVHRIEAAQMDGFDEMTAAALDFDTDWSRD